jgi:hypothetical protein
MCSNRFIFGKNEFVTLLNILLSFMTEIIRIRQLNQFGNREGKRGQYVILYVYEIYYCFPYYFDKASDITIVNHKHSPSI